ncbi:MAG: hypothetical protein K2H43_04525, partial [Clostridia bacterium]|nr:hypothetical protein [Clostridia bacterium]
VRGRVYLIVDEVSASENTKKKIEKLARRFSCPVIRIGDLESVTGKTSCKLAAVREESLARAVIAASGGEE